MKLPILLVGTALISSPLFAAEGSADLSQTNNRVSYALGVNFGSNLKAQGVEANLELVRKGIEDALAGKPQLNDTELRETFSNLRTQIQAHMEEKKKQNKAEGEKFLAD
ncbi:MAG TPA: FKBP-type peptidyl-prolyl cis-trans isomerase N-terminal domain-containing protein, partial [Verrucomicrobiae bacterium]|nr:FKBP-type peptidyl-prolyl cis-trans isomerase N-terminal domain-containing protein [Verrucomicrobiae bacterium]